MITLFVALTLAVPYLPQTEALCGGAAAAMVFRFLGDRHAGAQQFQPLVDTEAGGIADTVLIDAIRARGWRAERIDGSVATIQTHLAAGQPLILLLEDRPSRYHYVVAVGADEQYVFVHDPTWGPARRIAHDDLVRRWTPSGFWTLLVSAGDAAAPRAASVPPTQPRRAKGGASDCDRLLDQALDQIADRGLEIADAALASVGRQCPAASAPIRELAGVRFSQQRWRDAATLATQAVKRDDGDRYAWDVLGSSRFILNDTPAALSAWNHIDKPTLDSVQITGLTRTRYALVSQLTALTPNTLLTAGRLSLAERRLRALPDRLTTSVGYRPDDDGFATVNVAIVERPRWPRAPVDWASLGLQAAVDREVTVAVPGNTGQGELWEASWRWWSGRPRAALSFSAPRAGRFGGVWRIDGAWDAQTYRHGANALEDIREEHARGAIAMSNWVTPNVRLEGSSGLDAWSGIGRAQRSGFVGGALERRLLADRISLTGRATSWWPVGEGSAFHAASVRVTAQSRVLPTRFAVVADARADVASTAAPLAIWSGAGDGRARPGLLRAHPLLEDGAIDGPVFGRRVQSLTLEMQQWFRRPEIPHVAVAVFADAANATNRLAAAIGRPFQVDAGIGVRFRLPGSERMFRVDYAHGLRDRRANAITVGINNF